MSFYRVNYKQDQIDIGNSKFVKFLGWFLLIFGIIILNMSILIFLGDSSIKDNYTRECVFSEFGRLYYESNGQKIYIQNVYNLRNKEKITLDIPNNKTIMMYINNDNVNEGAYSDLNDTTIITKMNSRLYLIVSAVVAVIGLLVVLIVNKAKVKKITVSPIFLLSLLFFVAGITIVINECNNAIKYFNFKNNITTATIFSEIYIKEKDDERYKPVAYYYVDNQRYIYVNDSYVDGNLVDNMGETFELYYNENNPSEVYRKDNTFNIGKLLLGVFLSIIDFPIVFFWKKFEKAAQNQEQVNDWKI